jgi:putative ABC transport system substrate-binding protein
MLRRHFLLSGFAFLVTFDETLAESSRVWRVAYVASGVAGKSFEALRSALRNLGYQEGKNLILDLREANGDYSLLPDLAREAVSLKPDVIVAVATPAIAAVQKVTSTIPIVMSPATDPVGSGFVRSFAHPGGNITGVANMFGDLTAKTLDILHLVLPQVRKIGVLVSNNPTHLPLFEIAKRGAERIGISAERFIAETPDDLETAFKAMKSANCEAVYVLADPPRYVIPALAVKFSLPVIYQIDTFVQIGGLKLRPGPSSYERAWRLLRGSYPQRRQSCRHTCRAADHFPVHNQPSRRQSNWTISSGVRAVTGRQSDGVIRL